MPIKRPPEKTLRAISKAVEAGMKRERDLQDNPIKNQKRRPVSVERATELAKQIHGRSEDE